MGVVAPIGATGAAVPVLYDLARGVVPPPLQLLGVVVALLGCVLASGVELRGGDGAGGGPLPIALAGFSAVSYGILLLVIARGSEQYPAQTLTGMRLTSLLLTVALVVGTRSAGGVRAADLPVLACVGVADTLANVSFALASRSGEVGITAVLASLFPVVTALLARLVHGERLAGLQVVGVGAAITGIVLIAAG
jgi:drug/metabolite transporter (DMT)-like permease